MSLKQSKKTAPVDYRAEIHEAVAKNMAETAHFHIMPPPSVRSAKDLPEALGLARHWAGIALTLPDVEEAQPIRLQIFEDVAECVRLVEFAMQGKRLKIVDCSDPHWRENVIQFLEIALCDDVDWEYGPQEAGELLRAATRAAKPEHRPVPA